ncbi:MAG: aryl-sulfate sulfotransferase N-terminal domain-containing protein [Janthinobacterium lividum]
MGLGLLAALASCRKDAAETLAPTTLIPLHLALSSGTLTFNPSSYAPLAAQMVFTAPTVGRVRLVVHGRHGTDSDVVQQFDDQGTTHRVAILGVYTSFTLSD